MSSESLYPQVKQCIGLGVGFIKVSWSEKDKVRKLNGCFWGVIIYASLEKETMEIIFAENKSHLSTLRI